MHPPEQEGGTPGQRLDELVDAKDRFDQAARLGLVVWLERDLRLALDFTALDFTLALSASAPEPKGALRAAGGETLLATRASRRQLADAHESRRLHLNALLPLHAEGDAGTRRELKCQARAVISAVVARPSDHIFVRDHRDVPVAFALPFDHELVAAGR